jgi:hypothetical protein
MVNTILGYRLLKFKSETRNYTGDSWNLYDVQNLQILDKNDFDVCPFRDKLMNQDIFKVDSNGKFIEITHSSNRSLPIIPAILTFKKMYGKTSNNRYFFKATPDDTRVPEFIVPYKIKNMGFAKKLKNKYVIIKYESWEEKHPVGSIVSTIGDVEVLSHFYEYMLYCKSLHASIQQFTRDTLSFLRDVNEENHILQTLENPKYNIVDRREWEVICIDPKGSKDFDDGFGIKDVVLDDGTCCKLLSIYIANVPIWIDSMDLWSSFSERIATIYLPDRKRPMLPSILSDNLCSLQGGKTRFAFTLDIYVDREKYEIVKYEFLNTAVMITSNYDYDDKSSLLKDRIYAQTFNLISQMNHYKRYKYMDEILDSHDVIAYLMVMMNYLSAQDLKKHKTGIFRTIKLKTEYDIPEQTPNKIKRFIKGWNSTGGKYLKFEDYGSHELLNLDAYVHITSPIRRLVDILNIMLTMQNNGLMTFRDNTSMSDFYEKWTCDDSFDYINTSMRAIRRLQNKCELLAKCSNEPDILQTIYDGYCFDKLPRNDGLFQYVIYLPELKTVSKFTGPVDIEDFGCRKFQLYLFKDEGTFKQKIKMNLIE